MKKGEEHKLNGCEVSVILAALEESRDAHKQGIKSIQLNMDATSYVQNQKVDGIIKHLAELNGSVADLYCKHEERGKVVEEFKAHKQKYEKFTKPFYWMKKNWIIVVIATLVVLAIIVGVVEVVGLRRVIEEMWNKV